MGLLIGARCSFLFGTCVAGLTVSRLPRQGVQFASRHTPDAILQLITAAHGRITSSITSLFLAGRCMAVLVVEVVGWLPPSCFVVWLSKSPTKRATKAQHEPSKIAGYAKTFARCGPTLRS